MYKYISLFLSGLFLSCSSAFANGHELWFLVTDTQQRIELSRVVSFVAVDDSRSFSVLLDDNSSIQDVQSVTFELQGSSGVEAISDSRPELIFEGVSTIRISNIDTSAVDVIRIFDLSGRCVISQAALNGDNILDVASLGRGTYIVTVGSVSFKFIKSGIL